MFGYRQKENDANAFFGHQRLFEDGYLSFYFRSFGLLSIGLSGVGGGGRSRGTGRLAIGAAR